MTTEDYEFKTEAEAKAFELGVKLANNQDRVRVQKIERLYDWVVTLEILPPSRLMTPLEYYGWDSGD